MSGRIRRSVAALHPYAPGEQPASGSIIKLNTNENPYPPSPHVMAALNDIYPDALRRYPDPMCLQLRERIAGLHDVTPEHVFVGNGSDEVLALCTRAFVENDGTIGYFDTAYSLYPVLASIRDAQQVAFPLGPDFEWQTPHRNDCSLFFLANPNAPTGMLFPIDTVSAFCAQQTGVVLVDEAYGDFADDNAMRLARSGDRVIVARTLSKSYSLAGLRVGYAVGPSELIGALYKIKDSYNIDAVAQALALAAVTDVEHMRTNCQRIRDTRDRASAVLDELGYRVWPSQTNFLWVEPPEMSAKEVFEALRKRDIVVRHFAGERTGRHLRITVGTDDQMEALFDALKSIHSDGKP
ncbi:MAG: histidinol-phosphate transaminase [Verrucomicrobia bacterium]|nr:histidinol-phosphate transaminase [Verrucomicrobiota bacterium]